MDSALLSSSEQSDAAVARYLTISVDDGSEKDPKTADLLHKYGLQATFYVPARNPEQPVRPLGDIRELAAHFEVGSHTLSHLPIHLMSDTRASREIAEGKSWLEEVLGERVISFCYPRGKLNRTTPRLVRESGFLGACTTMMNLYDLPRTLLVGCQFSSLFGQHHDSSSSRAARTEFCRNPQFLPRFS